MPQLPVLPSHIRPLLNADAERLSREHDDLKRSPEDCLTCRGTKRYRWYATKDRTGGETVEWECNCVDQWILHRWMLNRGIGLNYQRLAWKDLVAPEQSVRTVIDEYNAHSDALLAAGMGLVFHGPMGNGKSMLANLLLKRFLVRGIDGYIVTFQELLNYFAAGWHSEEDRNWFHRRIRGAGLLVIDDLGREQRRAFKEGEKELPKIAEPILDDVLRHRLAMQLPTFITTNLELTKIPQLYGPNIGSLLEERSITCRFNAPDFRAKANDRLKTEAYAGLTRPVIIS